MFTIKCTKHTLPRSKHADKAVLHKRRLWISRIKANDCRTVTPEFARIALDSPISWFISKLASNCYPQPQRTSIRTMIRASTRNRKPSERALKAAATREVVRVRTTKRAANTTAKRSTKVSAKRAAMNDSSESEGEGNQCADNNDRKFILDAPALKGAFPFVEERIIGERIIEKRGKPGHDYLVSALPQWISADGADRHMVACWNTDSQLIVPLEHDPYTDISILQGYPMLDELNFVGTGDWSDTEVAAKNLVKEDAIRLLGAIISSCVKFSELSCGIDQYKYANEESEALAEEFGMGPATDMVRSFLETILDNESLEDLMKMEPQLRNITLEMFNEESDIRCTVSAANLFSGVSKLFSSHTCRRDGVKDRSYEVGMHFLKNSTIPQRRDMGRELLHGSPHFLLSTEAVWMPLLIVLLLPNHEIESMVPNVEKRLVTGWQAAVMTEGISQCFNCGSPDWFDFLPAFAALPEIIQRSMWSNESDDSSETSSDDQGSGNESQDDNGGSENGYSSSEPSPQPWVSNRRSTRPSSRAKKSTTASSRAANNQSTKTKRSTAIGKVYKMANSLRDCTGDSDKELQQVSTGE
jgi:hypothetical protein